MIKNRVLKEEIRTNFVKKVTVFLFQTLIFIINYA